MYTDGTYSITCCGSKEAKRGNLRITKNTPRDKVIIDWMPLGMEHEYVQTTRRAIEMVQILLVPTPYGLGISDFLHRSRVKQQQRTTNILQDD